MALPQTTARIKVQRTTPWLFAALLIALAAPPGSAQPGQVAGHQKISDLEGGFGGVLDDSDAFGSATAALGDLDGDGIPDLAAGAFGDDDGGLDRGAVWILFLNADGTVRSQQKISATQGGFGGGLDDEDWFGFGVAGLGDLDGDTLPDLAVGARLDDDGGANQGAVWILFLNADGTVKSRQKISATQGGFAGALDPIDHFGTALDALGDLDGDGVTELAVGARRDDDGGTDRGAVWTLFLNSDGTVKGQQKISSGTGGFAGALSDFDTFGHAVAGLGDLDGDGVADLAVGSRLDDTGGFDRGAVWIVFLNPDGTARGQQRIASGIGGFTGVLDDMDQFGTSVSCPGDLDADGIEDLFVGANKDGDGSLSHGAVWVLFLAADGTVREQQKISQLAGGFTGVLGNFDEFGIDVAALGDVDGDGVCDLASGALWDDDGGFARGAAWILFLRAAVWEDLGHQLAGAYGDPHLSGLGTLVAGEPFSLHLDDTLANSIAFLFIGPSTLYVPFRGGTLIPDASPPGLFTAFRADAAGEVHLTRPWPGAIPPGFTLFFQYWIADPYGPLGLSASNGLSATTP